MKLCLFSVILLWCLLDFGGIACYCIIYCSRGAAWVRVRHVITLLILSAVFAASWELRQFEEGTEDEHAEAEAQRGGEQQSNFESHHDQHQAEG